MPKVHLVKKARKDNDHYNIKAGDSYYWWKFRYGGKRYSKTQPRPSQLTQSEYLSTVYGLQEQIEDMPIDANDLLSAADELRSVADEIRNLGEEQESKIDNMPDSLQYSETAERLRTRASLCEELAGELESAADDIENLEVTEINEEECDEDEREMREEEAREEVVSQAQDILSGIGWVCDE